MQLQCSTRVHAASAMLLSMSLDTDYPTSDIPSWQPQPLRIPLYNDSLRPGTDTNTERGPSYGDDNAVSDDEDRDIPGSHVVVTDLY